MANENEDYKGYYHKARQVLIDNKTRVWSDVIIKTGKGEFHGIILPRSETADGEHIVVKLKNGYNTGIAVDNIISIEELAYTRAYYQIPAKEFPYDSKKPNVTLFGTGGTIASRLDYKTGAVIPAFSPGELYGAVPELANICNLKTEKLFGVFSENMGPKQYIALAEAIGREIEKGVDGIVIGHGTDTMHHTGAILSFMCQNLPIPVVLVGSQRSSDRPSSDAALNLINATHAAAYCDIAEVIICMFGPTSDIYDLLHSGTRVRKMHSSYRSTFRTIGDIPLCIAYPDKFHYLKNDYSKRDKSRKPVINTAYREKVSLIYYYPNMSPDIVDSLVDCGYKGIVIAGTGLGHVNRDMNDSLKRAIKKGLAIVMTVQTLWGYVQMYVYDTGRYLLELGVIPCGNMLPEVALMKLSWVLGQTSDLQKVEKMMTTPIAREITPREPHNGYLIMQGGIPEVEDFITTRRK